MNGEQRKKTTTTKQRAFNIEEYSNKARTALQRLREEQKPGQQALGGKAEIVRAVKDEIQKLLDDGYTEKQIAEAFSEDVFGILPKTITEIVSGRKRASNKPRTKQPAAKEPPKKDDKPDKPSGAGQKPGTFDVKPDSEDL